MIKPILILLLTLATIHAADPEVASDNRFLQNGKIKIGVDMTSGGSIFWFSELPDGPNLLNHHDRGRFIQQSYYGKPDGSNWAGKPWNWNPVQGGHYQGKPAKLLDSKITETSLYTKSIPINWAGGELLEECRMEQWIVLRDKVASIRFRFAYEGKDEHPPRHQELPAVFIDYALPNLVYYKGDKPWTGEALQSDVPGWPNEQRQVDEEWAAFTGPDGRGVGVFFPGTKRITCYRHPGKAGPTGGGCSYFAPIQTLAIKPGFRHDYRVHLTIGTPMEMRTRFKSLRPEQAP
jgi:hypothetical protein